MGQLSVLFVFLFTSATRAHIFQPGPPTLELSCVDSNVILRGLSDIECALTTPLKNPYNYAFVVRDGRCYTCRTADVVEPYRDDEQLLRGPHNLKACDPGWFQLDAYGCYMLNSTGMEWSNWKNVCDSKDALLVTMETQNEYDTLKQHITANADQLGLAPDKRLWLGATDVAQEGMFVWDDNGKQLTYSDWDTDQPNNWGDQDYVDYRFGYGWHDEKCFRNYGAICEYKTSRYSR